MDYRLPGSLVHGILQVRILEWVAMPSPPGNIPNPGTESMSLIPPALADGFFITRATWETLNILFSSVTQSCLILCDPRDCSTPGFSVHHQLPELTQTHVHWVDDAIQPSHPVIPFSSHLQSFPASGSFPMSQFFPAGSQGIGVSSSAMVLPMNIQD